MTATNGFDKNKFGFQEEINTREVIMNMHWEINKEFDKANYTVAIFIDIQEIFDTLDHNKLLIFLEVLGTRGVANNLIKSYLKKPKISRYFCK